MVVRSFPPHPYIGLAQYSADESLLFAGRESHVDACASIISQVETRILLVHGQTGCGKSSFLRAGLIPALETDGFGYFFLRRRANDNDKYGRPVFMRCGQNPLANLAREIYEYIARPVWIKTALGEREFDLSSAKLGATSLEDFLECCAHPQRLIEALAAISQVLPSTLVIVLDQVEEVLNLNPPDSPMRERFFTFLKLFNVARVATKLVLSLRKDHSGEFIGLAQLDNSIQSDFKVYLLPEMSSEEILTAIKRPTSEEIIGDGTQSPLQRYEFTFAPGVAESIVADLIEAIPSGAILPVMQIVCKDLYEAVCQGPQPWTIDDRLYHKSSLRVCVRRHISKSLRASFGKLALSERKLQQEENRWRKVLYRLVRYEGDGRVHTHVMSKSGFRASAKAEHALADADAVFESLARPDVLLLRRMTIPGVGYDTHEPMCSLGHDVVGLVLYEMEIEDQVTERHDKARRHRVLGMLAAAATVVLVVGYIGLNSFFDERALRQRRLHALLRDATTQFQDHAGPAFHFAMEGLLLTREIKFLERNVELQARSVLNRIMTALPDQTIPLPVGEGEDSVSSGRDSLLTSPPGFVSVRANSVLLNRLASATGTVPNQLALNLKFERDTYMSVSEPFDDCVLILFSSYSEPDVDQRFRLLIVHDGKLLGPFGARDLLSQFSRQAAEPSSAAAPYVLAISLAGDVVVLTTAIGDRQFVQTLVVNKRLRRGSEPFVPGTQLPMDVSEPMSRAVEVRVPPRQFIASGRLLSIEFERAKALPQYLGNLRLRSIQASSLRPMLGASATTWWRKAAEVPSIIACMREPNCALEAAPNPIRNRLVTLALVSSGPAATGQDRYVSGQFIGGESQVSYVIIDSETGAYEEIASAQLQAARTGCSILSPVESVADKGRPAPPATMREPEAPPFVDGVLGDLIFGFVRASSIQAVRIRAHEAHCSEHVYLSDAVREWRFVPGHDKLLAVSERDFLVWNLQQQPAPQATEPPPADVLLKRACEIDVLGNPTLFHGDEDPAACSMLTAPAIAQRQRISAH
jgi:hypothetical protein